MRRGLKISIALTLCALLLPGLIGCAWLGDLLHDASEPGVDPRATEPSMTESASPTDAGDGANPVFTFFIGFLNAYRRLGANMLTEALSSDDEEVMRAYMRLADDMALLTECYATVGMLPSASDTPAPFSGTLEGAYPGSGEIDRGGAFVFELADGGRIEGSVKDGMLISFRRESRSGASDIVIARSGRGYTARSAEGRSVRFLELTRDGLRYTEAADDGGTLAVGEPFFPENADAPVLSYSAGRIGLSE